MAASLMLGGLAWLWLGGHEIEVMGALLAAGAVAGVAAVYEDVKRAVRRRRARGLFTPGSE
ncbi:hypothetical protein ACWDG1_30355 [Streptomyces sp. NPDC001177]